MIKDRELELNFPRVSFFMFFMLHWQALTVASAIPIVWLDFAKICLPHPSTTASLMFCRFAKFLPKGKTWGRTRQRPAMTDFHRKVNKFWQRFAKCDSCHILHALKIQRKTVVQTKLKQHVITGLYYLRHISAGIEKDTVDWWSRLFLLYNSSQCLSHL